MLVDSEPLANRVLGERLASLGLHLTLEETMRRFVGRTHEGCLALAAEMIGRELPPDFGEQWDAALFEAFRRELKAVEGVAEVVRGLKVPYCVASNSSPERMRVSLGVAGLLPLFEGRLFSAASVARAKPAPDLFLHAAGAMKVAAADCAVIEDTPTGVQAALAAGMKVFAYKLDAPGATRFDSMRELGPRLRGDDKL